MFFITEAFAAGEAGQAAGAQDLLMQFLPLILIFVVFWFFLIRPQQKRQKEHAKMCEALSKGDEIVTIGGLSGIVSDVDEQTVKLKIAAVDGKAVEIRMQRASVQMVLPKGTLKF